MNCIFSLIFILLHEFYVKLINYAFSEKDNRPVTKKSQKISLRSTICFFIVNTFQICYLPRLQIAKISPCCARVCQQSVRDTVALKANYPWHETQALAALRSSSQQ
jgi:hypothetical protein